MCARVDEYFECSREEQKAAEAQSASGKAARFSLSLAHSRWQLETRGKAAADLMIGPRCVFVH